MAGTAPFRQRTRVLSRSLILLALCLLIPLGSARALPAAAYQVESISYPGATATSVRGVDATGRVLGYWAVYNQPPPFPIGAPPDDQGYFLWQDGIATPLEIPGLTNPNIHRMNVAGAMWGSSDQGAFVYRNGALSLLESTTTDVTLVQGVDAAGRVYGLLGNYPPGVEPTDPIVPIEPVSSFVWQDDAFSDLDLLLDGATLQGVRQDSVLWGSNADVAFLQDGASLTILDHPNFDHTGLHGVTSDGQAYGFGLTIGDETFSSTDFFWSPEGGFQDWPDGEPLPGTSLRPSAMNEAGVFWGYAGANTAFVAAPVPEPSTALFLAVGLALMRRAAATSPSISAARST